MSDESAVQPAVDAVDAMTEAEVERWIVAGDYSSIGGVALPASVSQRVTAFVNGGEVEGFVSVPPTPATPPGIPMPYPNIAHRKAGKGQQEFLKVTLTEIFISE